MTKIKEFPRLEFVDANTCQLTNQLEDDGISSGLAYHFVNSYTLVLANESSDLKLLLESNILVCDGKFLSLLLKRENPQYKQIRGADFMRSSLKASTNRPQHFFLGSTEEVLEKLLFIAKDINPRIRIAGHYSPEFKENFRSDIPDWIDIIRESGASIIWVGLGTPKQDYVVHEIAKVLPVHALAVGAAFDYLSGNFHEAPKVVQKIGLEWFYRLIREPGRLWRRYLIGNFQFLKILFIRIKKDGN